MKVILFALCFNEEKMLPHFIKYYSQYCDKIIFIDGGSTDRSYDIIKSNLKCELNLDYVSDKADDYTFLEIKNEIWKKYREEYDWCLIVDIDEFLYYPDGLVNLFEHCDKNRITVVRPDGYEMYSAVNVTENTDLFRDFNMGVREDFYSKMCTFNIKKLEYINYTPGCHHATPMEFGSVPAMIGFDLGAKFLHYRYLGLMDILEKKKLAFSRLSDRNKQNGFGIHNTYSDEHWIDKFKKNLILSERVI